MRYRLRTLLIILALGPPALAGAWLVGKPVVDNYLARQRQVDNDLAQQRQKDVWIDLGGPGTIMEFSTKCTFQETDGEADAAGDAESP